VEFGYVAPHACHADVPVLKPVKVIFKNSVRTAKKAPHFTVTKINWLRLIDGITAI
jgi:hypothetical protein